MRILMFHDFSDIRGGANQYRVELTNLLRAAGFSVSLFTYRQGDEEVGKKENVSVYPYSGDGPLTGRFKQHLINPGLYASLKRVIGDMTPDVVHVQGNCLFTQTVYLACPGGIPLIQTAHDIRLVCPNETGIRNNGLVCPWSFGNVCVSEGCVSRLRVTVQSLSKAVIRKVFRQSNRYLVSPSRALGENFSHFGIEPVLIPNFVDTGRFERSDPPSSSRTVLFVGSLYPSKGVDTLLRAFGEVHRAVSDARLVIVGEGPEEQNLRSMVEQLGVGPAVVFRGVLASEELDQVYLRSRVVVLPSVVKENCPLVILEAMAASRPVVASRLGGINELVQDRRNGFLVPYGDAESLARTLLGIFRDDESVDRMGRQGRELAENEYTPERHLERITGLYDKAVSRGAV